MKSISSFSRLFEAMLELNSLYEIADESRKIILLSE